MLPTHSQARQGEIIVAGVDTHALTHHVAVASLTGAILADQEFPATTAGYRTLLDWVAGHGVIDRIGVELTDAYGAGLTRHLQAEHVTVVQVTTTDRAARARRGKSDRLDAIAATQKVLAGLATAVPKDTTGVIESIRILSVVRASAVKARTQAINQFKALLVTAPAPLRESFGGLTWGRMLAQARALRPDMTKLHTPAPAAKLALKRLAARITDFDEEIRAADRELAALVKATAPTLIQRPQIGTHHAAQLLMTVSENIDRIPTDAAFARLCGAAPVPVSSGNTHRHRLHRGGDRQANRTLHMIIVGRLRNHPPTQDYLAKKLAQGHTKKDAIRALKRYVAREVFNILKTDLALS